MADADLVEGKKLTITKEGEELTFYYADMSDNGKYLYDRLEIVNKDLQGSKFAYEVKSNELNVLSDYYLKAFHRLILELLLNLQSSKHQANYKLTIKFFYFLFFI